MDVASYTEAARLQQTRINAFQNQRAPRRPQGISLYERVGYFACGIMFSMSLAAVTASGYRALQNKDLSDVGKIGLETYFLFSGTLCAFVAYKSFEAAITNQAMRLSCSGRQVTL